MLGLRRQRETSLDARSDTFKRTEIHPHQHGLADDIFFWNKTPITAVVAVVAVIAHHEIVPRRNRANHSVIIVFAIVAIGELADAGQVHADRIRIEQNTVIFVAEFFAERFKSAQPQSLIDFGRCAQALRVNFLAVHRQTFLEIGDFVARRANYTFDEIFCGVFGLAKDHDVAALRRTGFDDLLVDNRQPNAIGEFIDENKIAHLQCR